MAAFFIATIFLLAMWSSMFSTIYLMRSCDIKHITFGKALVAVLGIPFTSFIVFGIMWFLELR